MVTGSPAMISNSASKSARCMGRILASARRRPASSSAQIISRMARMRLSSKNMCSVRHSPMPSAPKSRAWRASRGRVGVGAHAERARRVGPVPSPVAKSPDSSGWRIFTRPSSTSPVPPSMVMTSPLREGPAGDRHGAGLVVDAQRAGAAHARPAHAARDHGGVAGHAAARGEDAGRRVHAVDVLGLVSVRTRITSRPGAFSASASSASNTISPEAAPGEAGRPRREHVPLGRRGRWSGAAAGRAPPASMRSTASSARSALRRRGRRRS